MLADRYGLPLSGACAVARDAYVQGCALLLTLYPGTLPSRSATARNSTYVNPISTT